MTIARYAGYPPFAVFLLLVVAGFFSLLLAGGHDVTGFIWLAFSLLLLLRVIWLGAAYAAHSRAQDAAAGHFSSLPGKILFMIGMRKNAAAAPVIAETLNRRLLVWLALGGISLLFALVSSWQGPDISGFLAQQERMEEFWAMLGRPARPVYDPLWQDRFAALGHLVICGLAFWLAQSYAVTRAHMLWLIALSGLLMLLALGVLFFTYGFAQPMPGAAHFGFWRGQGWGSYVMLQQAGLQPLYAGSLLTARLFEIGWIGTGFVYAAAGYAALLPLRHAYAGRAKLTEALPGPCIGLVMMIGDTALPADAPAAALWLACWLALGAVWMRSGHRQRKSYVMHQI